MSKYMGPQQLLTMPALSYMPASFPSSTFAWSFLEPLCSTYPLWRSYADGIFPLLLFFMRGRNEKSCSERRMNLLIWQVEKMHTQKLHTQKYTEMPFHAQIFFRSGWLSIWGVNQFQRQKCKQEQIYYRISFAIGKRLENHSSG